MKVCFFSTGNSLQGGAERCQIIIAEHLLKCGHEVHVVLQQESELTDHYRQLGAHVHRIYWQHLRNLSDPLHVLKYLWGLGPTILRVARLLRREHMELMHVNEILDFQGLIAARLAKVPGVVFVRTILPNRWLRRGLAGMVLKLADRVVCVSHAVHRMAMGDSPSKKVCVIYDGGPDERIFDPDRVEPIRQPQADGGIVLGLVAKLVPAKGHLWFVELADRLRRKGYTDVYYTIVGGVVAGYERYEVQLRDEIQRRGLTEAFWLPGKQLDVAPYISGMDVVCHLPAGEDPLPGVPMEAAAMRKPVLSFVSGGVPEELTHPTSARLVPIGDIDALVEHTCELIDDAALRHRMGDCACREVRSKFIMTDHLEQIGALYAGLTGYAKGVL